MTESMTEAIGRIREEDPAAIVIVQSDHRPALGLDLDAPSAEWSEEDLKVRFSALNTMGCPEQCAEQQDQVEGQPTVNTFRLVFACLEDRYADLLEQRAFVAPCGSGSTRSRRSTSRSSSRHMSSERPHLG